MVALGDLPGGSFDSVALAVSADGSVIVGRSVGASGTEAVIWTGGGPPLPLGDLPGGSFYSDAWGVSADGSIVVGRSNGTEGSRPFIWDSTNGMRDLYAELESFGIDLGDLDMYRVSGISANGLWVSGDATLWCADNECQLDMSWIAKVDGPVVQIVPFASPASIVSLAALLSLTGLLWLRTSHSPARRS